MVLRNWSKGTGSSKSLLSIVIFKPTKPVK